MCFFAALPCKILPSFEIKEIIDHFVSIAKYFAEY